MLDKKRFFLLLVLVLSFMVAAGSSFVVSATCGKCCGFISVSNQHKGASCATGKNCYCQDCPCDGFVACCAGGTLCNCLFTCQACACSDIGPPNCPYNGGGCGCTL